MSEVFVLYSLGTFCVLFGGWLVMCTAFQLLESSGALEGLKVQPIDKTSGRIRHEGFRDSIKNWAMVALLLPFSGSFLAAAFPADAPRLGLTDGFAFWLVSLIIYDAWFYVFHRVLHEVPFLYIKFHKPHHIYRATFVWMSTAQHPVEVMLNSIGVMAGPIIYLMAGRPISIFDWWIWATFVQFFGVVDHCGYELPFLPALPLSMHPEFHDMHHEYFNFNFGGYFTIWDRCFGTFQIKK